MLNTMGHKITELRLMKGLTCSELSMLTGVDVQKLRDIEGGQFDPDLICLSEICDSLGIELVAFFKLVEGRWAQRQDEDRFDLDVRPERPQTLEQYRQSLLWYQQKKIQFDWITQKRSKQFQTYTLFRERSAMLQVLAADPFNSRYRR